MIQYAYYWLMIGLCVPVFWMLPIAYRYYFLGVVSLAFIASVDAVTAALMLVIGGLVYVFFRPWAASPVSRNATKLSILIVLSCLAYFKYLPSIAAAVSEGYSFSKIALPLGISYFAFKLIHYAVENGRRTLPEHGFGDYLAFVFLVPIFTAGPIQRFDLFMQQRHHSWSGEHAWVGLTRISHGLIKKFVIGAGLLFLIDKVDVDGVSSMLAQLEDLSPFQVIAFLILSYLFVYMDFSGYTDIAIGTSRLFGIRIMENFNFPVLAPNIGNLWKRWHMSLANWCQSYIYMPALGWSRSPYAAVFSSFLVMGLWHAATLNWIAWGLYNALGVAVFQKWSMTARRRKWQFVKSPIYKASTYPMTFLFFAGSFAFTMTNNESNIWGALRLLAKCLFIDLPA